MSVDSRDPLIHPEAGQWIESSNRPATLLQFVGERVGIAGAAAVARLLWPRFVEYRGAVIREEAFNAVFFDQWWTKFSGDIAAIESMVNHLHLWDVFAQCDDEASFEIMDNLLPIIRSCWSAALAEAFPNRRFEVWTANEPDDYGPTIGFHSQS